MADYTVANLVPTVGVNDGFGGEKVTTITVEADLTKLAAPLVALDTVDLIAVPADFLVFATKIEVIEAMTGTSLVGDAINLEEQAGSTDLSGTITPSTAGDTTAAATQDLGAVATNLELAFALTSGTVTSNGKYRIKIVGMAL